MKLSLTARQVLYISSGMVLLLGAFFLSLIVSDDENPGSSAKKHSKILPLHSGPPVAGGPTKNSAAAVQSRGTDPLMGGIYSDDLATVKARFLTDFYSDDYGLYLSAFAAHLAKEEPEEGLRWLLSLESSNDLQRAASTFAVALRSSAPDKLEWALKQSMPVSIYQAVVSGAAASMVADLDSATRFIKKVSSSPKEADWLARSLVMTLSQDRSPEGSLKLIRLGDEFPNAVPSEQCGEALYHLWTANPEKALAIMESKNDFQANPGVFASFSALYARNNLDAASKWVNELPDGLPKDYAIGSIAKASSHVSPLGGLRWAISIRDSNVRPQIMTNLVELSAYHDPQATRQIIEEAGFSPEESAKWIARINQQEAKLR